MKQLKNVHALTEFFVNKPEDAMSELLKQTQQDIRERLNLPPNIRLSGLTFEHVDLGNGGVNALDCEKTCSKWMGDHWFYYCCKP